MIVISYSYYFNGVFLFKSRILGFLVFYRHTVIVVSRPHYFKRSLMNNIIVNCNW